MIFSCLHFPLNSKVAYLAHLAFRKITVSISVWVWIAAYWEPINKVSLLPIAAWPIAAQLLLKLGNWKYFQCLELKWGHIGTEYIVVGVLFRRVRMPWDNDGTAARRGTANIARKPPKARMDSLTGFRRSLAPLTPWLQACLLQKWEIIYPHCFKLPSPWYLFKAVLGN